VSWSTAVAELPAHALLDHYRSRELSPVEVLDACLARIGDLDPSIHAFCLVDAEQAKAEALRSELRWHRREPAGLLDGVPVGIKDVFLTKGWPTRRGFGPSSVGPWSTDAPAVAAMRRHGGIFVGKTTTPQFGWKAVTDSPAEGVTRNPWDLSRTPGGSSGGSAAALASGMVALATGTDGGGSIRIPSAFCGLPGLKPTFGRVPFWPPSRFRSWHTRAQWRVQSRT
jgi:aspartyl-tRNA(Asn)/glutamyl-tRNA(Gln) amidotransferase subunit A